MKAGGDGEFPTPLELSTHNTGFTNTREPEQGGVEGKLVKLQGEESFWGVQGHRRDTV